MSGRGRRRISETSRAALLQGPPGGSTSSTNLAGELGGRSGNNTAPLSPSATEQHPPFFPATTTGIGGQQYQHGSAHFHQPGGGGGGGGPTAAGPPASGLLLEGKHHVTIATTATTTTPSSSPVPGGGPLQSQQPYHHTHSQGAAMGSGASSPQPPTLLPSHAASDPGPYHNHPQGGASTQPHTTTTTTITTTTDTTPPKRERRLKFLSGLASRKSRDQSSLLPALTDPSALDDQPSQLQTTYTAPPPTPTDAESLTSAFSQYQQPPAPPLQQGLATTSAAQGGGGLTTGGGGGGGAGMEPFTARKLPEFAIAEPTPQMETFDNQGASLLHSNPPVKYGDYIRLWTAMGGAGGFMGYAARDERRIKGTIPGTRFNFGMNDTFFVLPPFRHNRGWFFKETYFKVRDPRGVFKDGSPVLYGREVLLVDEEEQVMCHYRGRKYIRRKPLGTTGEMTVAFMSSSGDGGGPLSIGPEVTYGDTDIKLRLVSRKQLNTQPVFLSILKRDGIDAVGGFLNCQQQGQPLSFDIEHAPPRIVEISISSTLMIGDRQYAHKGTHHATNWGEEIAFLTPSCQGHRAEEHDGCVIRVNLSTGARLKMRQEHLDRQDEKGRWREVWVPTKGAPEPGLLLLVRLVHADTITTDPRRHYTGGGSSNNNSGAFGQLQEGIVTSSPSSPPSSTSGLLSRLVCLPLRVLQQHAPPLGLVVLFVALALAYPPTDPLPVRAARLAHTSATFAVALLAYLVLDCLASHLGLGSSSDSGGMPSSMEFDEWRLAVVDWRIGGTGGAVPAALPPEVPDTFVIAENGDLVKARARYERTLQWRKDLEVDDILRKPHPKYRVIKRYYPVVFHFRDKMGHVCFYQILGKLNVAQLMKHSVDTGELVRHTILLQEFLWTVLCPSQHDRVTLIMDLRGVTFSDVTGEVLNFIKQTVSLTSTHYPARSYRMLLLNVPGWFNLIFKLIKPMLNDTMRQKIVFLDEGSVKEGLTDVIDDIYVPKEYGGKCEVALGEAPEEKQLEAMVESVLDDHDMAWEE